VARETLCAEVLARVVVDYDTDVDPVLEIAFNRNDCRPLSRQQQVECVRPASGRNRTWSPGWNCAPGWNEPGKSSALGRCRTEPGAAAALKSSVQFAELFLGKCFGPFRIELA